MVIQRDMVYYVEIETASNSIKQHQTASNSIKQHQTASNSIKQHQTAIWGWVSGKMGECSLRWYWQPPYFYRGNCDGIWGCLTWPQEISTLHLNIIKLNGPKWKIFHLQITFL